MILINDELGMSLEIFTIRYRVKGWLKKLKNWIFIKIRKERIVYYITLMKNNFLFDLDFCRLALLPVSS